MSFPLIEASIFVLFSYDPSHVGRTTKPVCPNLIGQQKMTVEKLER